MTTAPAISMSSASAFLSDWRASSAVDRQFLLAGMTKAELTYLNDCWALFAHPHQMPPALANGGDPWLTWLLIGGRGAGKTRAGAEWIRAQALGEPPLAQGIAGRIALVGELTVECAALWAVLLHEFWTGDIQTITALVNATALLVTYWGFRFGVLGVYISGRTREKLGAATGQDTPGLLEKLIKAVVTKDGVKKK
jgi:hypothetical protein